MTANDIIRHRLANQQLLSTAFTTHQDMVSYMGAMQAQDYTMSKWAIGIRQPSATDKSIEQKINDGDIIRTHILRPTWHLVAAKDIRWMMALTGPHVKTINHSACKRRNLDKDVLIRCNKIIEKILRDNKQLTRPEIMAELDKKGIPTDDIRPALIMMNAELDGLVCNGAMRDKEFTYALLEERVQPTKALTQEEALAELAKRYFISHGPATLQDFIWWSGLSIKNARIGLELTKAILSSFQFDDAVYWFKDSGLPKNKSTDGVQLLPAFDEFLISYKNRTATIAADHHAKAVTVNGIFKPIMINNGKVIGTWKRSLKKDTTIIECNYFDASKRPDPKLLADAARHYGNFLGMKTLLQ